MTQHTQWIPVSAEGAEQSPGFRCDGCGQVKWQAEPPLEACDICAEFVPARATFAPGAEQAPEGGAWSAEMEKPEQLKDPATMTPRELDDAPARKSEPTLPELRPRRSRNQEDK